jgi:hypothetical protein
LALTSPTSHGCSVFIVRSLTEATEFIIIIVIVRWVANIRIDLGEVEWGDVGWIGLAKDRNRWRALVNSVLNFRVP